MLIKQCRISRSLTFFGERFLNKYNFERYYDFLKPAFFFGCYGMYAKDCQSIINHRSLAVVIYGGSDAMNLKTRPDVVKALKRSSHVKHIAISKFVSDDLAALGIAHIRLPICPTVFDDYKTCPLGNSVYVYSSHANPTLYNERMAKMVEKLMDYEFPFIYGYSQPPGHFTKEQLMDIYKNTFIGLRLTDHDGLPNTMIELGLMGRRVIWNGSSPNAIPFKNSKDIVRTIRKEAEKIGTINNYLNFEMRSFLDIGSFWKDSEYYA